MEQIKGKKYCLMWVQVALGLVLIIAAILKAMELSDPQLYAIQSNLPLWLLVLSIEFELTLGIWLAFQIYQRACIKVAILTFALLACIAVGKINSGVQSCDCFGPLETSPWVALAIDLTAVLSLSLSEYLQFPICAGRSAVRRIAVAGASWVLMSFVIAIIVARGIHVQGHDGGIHVLPNGTIVLNPDLWIGRRLPILPYLDIGAHLNANYWTILFVSSSCSKCNSIISDFQQSEEAVVPHRAQRTAIVDLANSDISELPPSCFIGRFTHSQNNWKMAVPVEVQVDRGIVTSIKHY